MAALVHLVTHADEENPASMVLGAMPGFGLSALGMEQARRVGRYLGPRALVAIWSSPLERALRTAEEIAARSAVPVRVDDRLGDWDLFERWQGNPWHTIGSLYPEEAEIYLDDPDRLDGGETLENVAQRMSAVVRELEAAHPHGDVVVVSHPDPIQAVRLSLTGADLKGLHDDRPSQGSVITMRPGTTWREETTWGPEQSPRFGERPNLRAVPVGAPPEGPSSA